MHVKYATRSFVILTAVIALISPISSQAKSTSSGEYLSDLVLPNGWTTATVSPCAATIQALRQCGRWHSPLALSYKGSHSPERLQDPTWSKWETSLDESISSQFAKHSNVDVGGKLLVCEVQYGVTKTGNIVDLRFFPPDNNSAFESMIRTTLKDISKEDLAFPASSEEAYVKRSGYFIQNYGPTFIEKKRRETSQVSPL